MKNKCVFSLIGMCNQPKNRMSSVFLTGVTVKPFDVASVQTSLERIREFVVGPDGNETGEKIQYLIGWTCIPLNMMRGGLGNFLPVDAFDAAGMRGKASGS